jgi:hypothetical protein
LPPEVIVAYAGRILFRYDLVGFAGNALEQGIYLFLREKVLTHASSVRSISGFMTNAVLTE